MNLLYLIHFGSFKNNDELYKRLTADKYWVFSEGDKDPSKFDATRKQRVRLFQQYLHITKFTNDKNLTPFPIPPRTELRLENDDYKFDMNVNYQIDLNLLFPDNKYSAEFMQILGRFPQVAPVLQLEVRKLRDNVVYFTARGKWLKNQPIKLLPNPFMTYLNKPMEWRVQFNLSKSNTGYIRVFANGVKVLDTGLHASFKDTTVSKGWFQYGAYATHSDKVDMNIYYSSISIVS